MRQFLLKVLNQHFRPTNPVEVSFFPRDEFDEDEAEKLKCFCEVLRTKGYDEVFKQKVSSELRETLGLAAEYV
jgi:hypothetical protein